MDLVVQTLFMKGESKFSTTLEMFCPLIVYMTLFVATQTQTYFEGTPLCNNGNYQVGLNGFVMPLSQ